MATRGRHAPFHSKRRRKRWDRHYRVRPEFFATDEDDDSILIGPGDERDSAVPPRG